MRVALCQGACQRLGSCMLPLSQWHMTVSTPTLLITVPFIHNISDTIGTKCTLRPSLSLSCRIDMRGGELVCLGPRVLRLMAVTTCPGQKAAPGTTVIACSTAMSCIHGPHGSPLQHCYLTKTVNLTHFQHSHWLPPSNERVFQDHVNVLIPANIFIKLYDRHHHGLMHADTSQHTHCRVTISSYQDTIPSKTGSDTVTDMLRHKTE